MKPHTHDVAAGDIPQVLCRLGCNEAMELSPEERKRLDAEDKKWGVKAAKLASKQREAARLERELTAPRFKKPLEGSRAAKDKKVTVAKLQRLQKELTRTPLPR